MKLHRVLLSLFFLIPLIGLAVDEENSDINAQNEQGYTLLYIAAGRGDADSVINYMEARADPEIADLDDVTPLHRAAAEGYMAVVVALVEAGNADVNPVDNTGATPLDYANALGRTDVVNYLIEQGGAEGASLFKSTLDERDEVGEEDSELFFSALEDPLSQTDGIWNLVLRELGAIQVFCDEMYGNGSL